MIDFGHDAYRDTALIRTTVVMLGNFELAPTVPEEALDGGDIKPAGDLLKTCHGEVPAGHNAQSADFALFSAATSAASAPFKAASATRASASCSLKRLWNPGIDGDSLDHRVLHWFGLEPGRKLALPLGSSFFGTINL